MDVVITHPYFGTVYLEDAKFHVVQRRGRRALWVHGEAWDDKPGGSNYDDWRGEPVTLNFPATCIREVVH